MKIHRAIGATGTLYEVRGVDLFIDGEPANRSDGKPWESVADAKNAADSAEIAENHKGLRPGAWSRSPR